ncbi:hypothetical protein SCANM63S_04221 [Streptomyces canarius]
MPSRSSARLAALTVAAVCSAASAVVLTSPAHADSVRVHDIQGTTRTSPFAGQKVTDVPGIVTATRTYGSSRGFWIQDPAPDDNPATSEGVFVFTSSTPKVAVGDAVKVTGTVSEYVPGGNSSGNQSLTEITKPVVTTVSTGNAVPAPVVVDEDAVPDAYAPAGDAAAANSVNGLPLDPSAYALDYYESLEGMNVQVADVRVVTATDPYSELWVTVKPWEHRSRRGGTVYGSYDSQNTGRLQIQSLGSTADFPKANVGDTLEGTTTGPLDFNQYGGYTLVASELGTLKSAGLERETTREQSGRELAVATYNVENLDPSDATFGRHASAIVHHLQSPDIVSLEEIQDNNGAKDDGTVDAGPAFAEPRELGLEPVQTGLQQGRLGDEFGYARLAVRCQPGGGGGRTADGRDHPEPVPGQPGELRGRDRRAPAHAAPADGCEDPPARPAPAGVGQRDGTGAAATRPGRGRAHPLPGVAEAALEADVGAEDGDLQQDGRAMVGGAQQGLGRRPVVHTVETAVAPAGGRAVPEAVDAGGIVQDAVRQCAAERHTREPGPGAVLGQHRVGDLVAGRRLRRAFRREPQPHRAAGTSSRAAPAGSTASARTVSSGTCGFSSRTSGCSSATPVASALPSFMVPP